MLRFHILKNKFNNKISENKSGDKLPIEEQETAGRMI